MLKGELTPSMKAFCLNLVQGLGKVEAYRKAYKNTTTSDRVIEQRAFQLARDPRCIARIASLQAVANEAARKLAYGTLVEIIQAKSDLVDAAIKDKKYGPANQALTDIAKMTGLYNDKLIMMGPDNKDLRIKIDFVKPEEK